MGFNVWSFPMLAAATMTQEVSTADPIVKTYKNYTFFDEGIEDDGTLYSINKTFYEVLTNDTVAGIINVSRNTHELNQ